MTKQRRVSLLIAPILFSLLPSAVFSQDWTDWQGANGGARIRAGLRDRTQNAAKHVAAVEVEVQNVWLNYPDAFVQPGIRVGVLQYELDQCPKVLTTDTRLSFRDLSPGTHTITVSLLDLNDRMMAPEARMTLAVP